MTSLPPKPVYRIAPVGHPKLAGLFVLFFASAVVCALAPDAALAAGVDPDALAAYGSPLYLVVANGSYLELDFGFWLVYLPPTTSAGRISLTSPAADAGVRGYILTETGSGPLPGNNVIPWPSGQELLQFSTSDPQVATVSPAGEILFLKPGWVQVTVKSSVSEVNYLYQVMPLAFGIGASKSDVIASLGEPDVVQPVKLVGPAETRVHGRLYQADKDKTITVEHWQWEAYPGLVVVVNPATGKVDAIINWGQEFLAEAFREATRPKLKL
ncbi:MAG TPA: hypothetical protein GXX55_01970 [Firmicutes bacterium]|nr:hypothetical protein [Bacillota bacterium]